MEQGKSTLMRILTGEDVGDTGKVTTRTGIKISMLPQETFFDGDLTVNEVIENADTGLIDVIKDYEIAIQNQSDSFLMTYKMRLNLPLHKWIFITPGIMKDD